MSLIRLFWRLLRYRVAVMLILFMLLSAAIHINVAAYPWPLLTGVLALAFSYVSATSSNDLADFDIDRINHPDSVGRPLVTGGAKRLDMWRLFTLTSLSAVGLAAMVNLFAALIMAASIIINIIYSLPPARFSYRTFLAPLTLGIAYVGIPYFLALALTGSHFTKADVTWFAGLYFLFIGRIILKDFRDRKGDARYHKPTFLLRFGKPATCWFSLICLIIGGGLLESKFWQSGGIELVILIYLVSIGFMLLRLFRENDMHNEQVIIGVGARLGNGLLISLLTIELLKSYRASSQTFAVLVLAFLFLGSFLLYLQNPRIAVIGYKG